jgi:hypothetical protein
MPGVGPAFAFCGMENGRGSTGAVCEALRSYFHTGGHDELFGLAAEPAFEKTGFYANCRSAGAQSAPSSFCRPSMVLIP